MPKSEVYEYNNSIVLFAIIQSESSKGQDKPTIEQLREISVEKMSTVDSYTNENDLQLYFSGFKSRYNSEVLFIKKRDDTLERLFSAYALIKDANKDIYPTNTLHLNLLPTDFDLEYEQSDKYLLKPGRLFKYKADSRDTAEIILGKTLKDDISTITEEFLYTNPYLMTVSKKPSIVGFYMNSLSQRLPLEYSYVNNDSLVQFICNNLFISRNALAGEDQYTLSINLTPTSELGNPIIDKTTGADLGILKLKGFIEDTGSEIAYIDFTFKEYDAKSNIYTFEAKMKTDDYMTLAQKLRFYDINNITTSAKEIKLLPMIDCKMNIYAFYKYTDLNLSHKYDYISDIATHSLTNIYSTIDQKITFINPINAMRSQIKYIDAGSGNYYINTSFIPLVKASIMQDKTKYADFIERLRLQYEFLLEVIDKVINNFGIDMKFYNAYGKSKNFVVGEEQSLLDKVNCKITFKVAVTAGTVINDLIRDLKIFIKDYIENINNKGSNSIYVSNLIQAIENTFAEVKYLKFSKINNYDSSVQVIDNKSIDINLLTKEERQNYVPEYLTIDINDISIEIL
jgi:hypothetical protein